MSTACEFIPYGQIDGNVKATFNTEKTANDEVRVLDAFARFEFAALFNLWFGRFLPPADRVTLDGPYYLNAYEFPFVSNYPAIFAGRNDGAV